MNIESILEAAILCQGEPLPFSRMKQLFAQDQVPSDEQLQEALGHLMEHYAQRGIQLVEVKSGYRFQTDSSLTPHIQRLHEKKPPRASTAYLETLAIIAYQQPATRGEIEDVRGVGVSTSIIRSLMDRDWIRVMGYRDVPGKPALYGTTKRFLDDFSLKSLKELPPLKALQDVDQLAEGGSLQMNLSFNTDSVDSPVPSLATEEQSRQDEVSPETVAVDDRALDAAYDQADALFNQCDVFIQQLTGVNADVDDVGGNTEVDLEVQT